MPLNFPSTPTLNQVYTSGSYSWKWNGSAWEAYNPYATIRRFATGPAPSSSVYAYCGTAPIGTAEATALWTIIRLTIDASGATTATMTATPAGGVDWTGYAGHVYV